MNNINPQLNYLLTPISIPHASLSPPTPELMLNEKQAAMTSSHACQTGSASRTISVINELPSDLGKYIDRDVSLVKRLGWHRFVQLRRRRGDFVELHAGFYFSISIAVSQ